MFYEVIVWNKAGMQVYKFETQKEAFNYVRKFHIEKPIMNVITIGSFGNKVLIQEQEGILPEQRVYLEDVI